MTMPNGDRFEQELARVVRDGAPDTAPSELRDRVAMVMAAQPVMPNRRGSSWLLGAAAGVVVLVAVTLALPRLAPPPGATSPGSATAPTLGATAIGSPLATLPTATGTTDEPIVYTGFVQLGTLLSPQDGVVMNVDGRVLITASGGRTWRDITPDRANADRTRFFFLDPQHGWITSYDDTATDGLVIWRTDDGGRFWTAAAIATLRSVNWDLVMLSPTVGYLASDPGGQDPKPELRWTDDGGVTWTDPIDLAAATGIPTLGTVDFLDRSNGVMTGDNVFLHTSDGGRTWSAPKVNNTDEEIVSGTPRYGAVQVIDDTTAFVVIDWLYGDGVTLGQTVIETFNGGADWVARYGDARRRSWAFIDATNWIATDGKLMWSTNDGGSGWGGSSSYGLPLELDFAGHYVPEDYLPEELAGERIYRPSASGFEAELQRRLAEIAERKRSR